MSTWPYCIQTALWHATKRNTSTQKFLSVALTHPCEDETERKGNGAAHRPRSYAKKSIRRVFKEDEGSMCSTERTETGKDTEAWLRDNESCLEHVHGRSSDDTRYKVLFFVCYISSRLSVLTIQTDGGVIFWSSAFMIRSHVPLSVICSLLSLFLSILLHALLTAHGWADSQSEITEIKADYAHRISWVNLFEG